MEGTRLGLSHDAAGKGEGVTTGNLLNVLVFLVHGSTYLEKVFQAQPQRRSRAKGKCLASEFMTSEHVALVFNQSHFLRQTLASLS